MASKEFGDFQTPLPLVRQIVELLGPVGQKWTRVLEPTCGRGNFIRGLLESPSPPDEIIGVEIQQAAAAEASSLALLASAKDCRLRVLNDSAFGISFAADLRWQTQGPLLVLGNPPWVTNAELGSLGSSNLPRKSNIKGLRGILALTGHSNFDIAESIWIKLLSQLRCINAHVALLCKTSVARNVLTHTRKVGLPVSGAALRMIDARRWFGASVGACLFSLDLNAGPTDYEADVFDDLMARSPSRKLGFAREALVADIENYRRVSFVEGASPLEWRQGIKHDAAALMELTFDGFEYHNASGEVLDIEADYIFPLLKSSSLASGRQVRPQLAVIVPQKALNEDSTPLRHIAPRLWRYLHEHADVFRARKSSIYKGRPLFSIFGIGDYSFAAYKVAVSGLHKRPRFVPVGPCCGKPTMLDDTCYFVPCDSAGQAATLAGVLNHPITASFIASTTFNDAKRPITKALLSRIDVLAVARQLPWRELADSASQQWDRFVGDAVKDRPEWPADFSAILDPTAGDRPRTLFA